MNEFFAMGGYAFYVWPAYIIAAAIIGGMAIQTILQWRRARDRLRLLESDRDQASTES
jgi:heme exporter protein D